MAILMEWGISQWPFYWNGVSVNGNFTGMGYQSMAILLEWGIIHLK